MYEVYSPELIVGSGIVTVSGHFDKKLIVGKNTAESTLACMLNLNKKIVLVNG